jgi:hypothetical protein
MRKSTPNGMRGRSIGFVRSRLGVFFFDELLDDLFDDFCTTRRG